MPLSLEIVTPRGPAVLAENLDEVVVRRLETDFPDGSEIAIMPRHAPLLVETSRAVRWRSGDAWQELVLGPGICEVLADRVTIAADSV